MKESISVTKTFNFALRVIALYKNLIEQKEYILSKQLLRSGTSIGAQISESEYAQSRADFIHKFSIAIKEANETIYWLRLLYSSSLIDDSQYNDLLNDCTEILKILTASLKTAKSNKN